MNSKAEHRKQEIISGLIEARECILQAVSVLSKERQDEVFLGIWSVKDLLAHLVGWDYTNVEASKEILAGQLPSFYEQHDPGWKSYNAQLVAQYKKEELAELVRSVEKSHRELVEFLKPIPAEELEKDRGLRAGRYKVTIGSLLQAEIKDEKKHCAQIQEFAARGGNA